jgi:hypothetical protein
MALYSLSRRGTVTTSGSASSDCATPTASGVRPKLMEVGLFNGAGTASTFGLNRTTALGTRTSPLALEREDEGDNGLAGIMLVDMAIAHSAQPTFGANDLRRIAIPATIGTGIIWTFPRGLVIGQQLSIAMVNRATNTAAADTYYVVDV